MPAVLASLKTIIISLMVMCAIEGGLFITLGSDPFPPVNELVHFSYYQPRQEWPFVVAWKIARYIDKPYDIVVTGDSTGLFGLDPVTLQKYLDGKTVLNVNCCGLLGQNGYRAMATIFVKHNKSAKYLVFSGTLFPYKNKTGNHVAHVLETYDSVPSFYTWLPSMRLRSTVAAALFYGESAEQAIHRHFIGIVNRGLINNNNHGWVSLNPMLRPSETKECKHALPGDSVVLGVKNLQKMAANYNLRLVVMLNPLNCIPTIEMQSTIKELTRYLHSNPDILSPLPLVRIYEPALFADNVHLNVMGAQRNSREFGAALASVINLTEGKYRQMPAQDINELTVYGLGKKW